MLKYIYRTHHCFRSQRTWEKEENVIVCSLEKEKQNELENICWHLDEIVPVTFDQYLPKENCEKKYAFLDFRWFV